ncbi:hypothetical protein [Sorangium sp. So ce1182]|uniref:hypothetical protein n=1 Tax=Sorangium sp. So ce1182 TaxID=3133334 RepID=UPI003F5E37C2
MVLATDSPDLGIYLDWQGSNVEFFARLLDVLGRREQPALVRFLEGMGRVPHVSDERKPVLAALRARVAALSAAEWQQEFVTAAVAPAPAAAPDPALLAATVVTQVLAPYYKLGAAEIERRAGAVNARLGEQLARALDDAFAGDPAAASVLEVFKRSPDVVQAALLHFLKTKFVQKPALARELSERMAAAAGQPGDDQELLIDVSQTVGTIGAGASVIGAVLGNEVLSAIKGKVTAQVVQNADVVQGSMVGIKM